MEYRFKVGQRVIVDDEVFTITQMTIIRDNIPAYFMKEQDGKFRDSDCHNADHLDKFRNG